MHLCYFSSFYDILSKMPTINIKTNTLQKQTKPNALQFIIRTMNSDLSGVKIPKKILHQPKVAKSKDFIQHIKQTNPSIKNKIQQPINTQPINTPKEQEIPIIKLEQTSAPQTPSKNAPVSEKSLMPAPKQQPEQKTEKTTYDFQDKLNNAEKLLTQKQEELKQALEEKNQEHNKLAKLEQELEQQKLQMQNEITKLKQSLEEQQKSLKPVPVRARIIKSQTKAILEPKQPIPVTAPISSKKKTTKSSKMGAVMSILIIILLATLSILIYFIFFNKPESEQITKQEPEVIVEPELELDPEPEPNQETKTEPNIKIPNSLIPVEKDLILNLNLEQEILIQIQNLLEQTPDMPRMSQLVLAQDNKPNNLNNLLSNLRIFLPEHIKNNLTTDYTLLSFAPNSHFELGLILKIKNTLPVLSELSIWQKNMSHDLKSLFINQKVPETTEFRINNQEYPNIVIHFQNTPDIENSMHYTISKNNLIISPSSSSMHLILNSMLTQ